MSSTIAYFIKIKYQVGSLMRFQQGLSMVEMMVALALSTFLVLGIIQVFSASKAAYMAGDGLSRVQENGRFALDFLQRDARMAGNLGCLSDMTRFEISPETSGLDSLLSETPGSDGVSGDGAGAGADPAYAYYYNIGIEGFEWNGTNGTTNTDTYNLATAFVDSEDVAVATGKDDWSPNLHDELYTILENKAVKGSDVLVLRFFSGESVPLVDVTGPNVALISADDIDFVISGHIYGITSCRTASIFQAYNGGPGVVNIRADAPNRRSLVETYSADDYLHRAESMIYFVGKGTSGRPSLMLMRMNNIDGSSAPQELVDGVESMQISYGYDNQTGYPAAPGRDGQVDAYGVAADDAFIKDSSGALVTVGDANYATNWRQVIAVRIGLLLASDEVAAGQPPAGGIWNVNGVGMTPSNDGRIRQVYETTIQLRNRSQLASN